MRRQAYSAAHSILDSCLFSDTTLICQQTAATVPSAAQCAKNSERGGPKWLLSKTVAKVAKATAFTKFFIASKIESSRSFVFVSAWDSEFTSLMSPKRRESKHRSLNARYWRTDSLDELRRGHYHHPPPYLHFHPSHAPG